MDNNQPVFGYSVQDIPQLEVEVEQLKHKRNTMIIIGATIAGIAIVCAIAIFVVFLKDFGGAINNREAAEELRNKEIWYDLGFSVLALMETAGQAIALAGGITNGIKAKKRAGIVKRLKEMQNANPQI